MSGGGQEQGRACKLPASRSLDPARALRDSQSQHRSARARETLSDGNGQTHIALSGHDAIYAKCQGMVYWKAAMAVPEVVQQSVARDGLQ